MHVFDVNRKRRIPDVICNCADLTAPDGHLYTQDEIDVKSINNPDGSMSSITIIRRFLICITIKSMSYPL